MGDLGGPKEPCIIDSGPETQWEGAMFGGCPHLSGPLKSIGSHCCGVRSKTINNGISATAADDCIAPNFRCHIKFSP